MRTVLIVEDDPDSMLLSELIMGDMGFIVLKSVNAEDGLSLLKETHVDLILMDISLPGINGIEAIKIIRKMESLVKTRIIVITSYAMESDMRESMLAGSNSYLTKPLDDDLLKTTVNGLF